MTIILVPMTRYPGPLTADDEQRAIHRVAIWVAMVRHTLSKEYSREWLETTLRQCLYEGDLEIAKKAVEAADQGDELADAALREVGAELWMPSLQGRDLAPGHLQVIAYVQRVTNRAPHKRKRGRYAWVRNITICILVQLACAEFGVLPTRSRESAAPTAIRPASV